MIRMIHYLRSTSTSGVAAIAIPAAIGAAHDKAATPHCRRDKASRARSSASDIVDTFMLASKWHLHQQCVAHLDAKPCVATCASRKHIAQSVSSGGHQKRSDCGGQRAARERAPAAQGHRPKHIGRRPEQARLIGDAKPAATAPAGGAEGHWASVCGFERESAPRKRK